jgi:leucyl-tRNA synthetase
MTAYPFESVEKKWQARWASLGTYRTPDSSNRPKYYVLDMFPYPSGAGLHVGHLEGYTASDIVARYKRLKGFEVLHPMGWDAFGLPAEQYALDTGTHPSVTTARNVANFKRQINAMGFCYDWEREVNTTDPAYYRWTQWIFMQLFKKGLAYRTEAPVNFCTRCRIVVANEEVEQGLHERCHQPVVRRNMKQWMLRITAYADRLLEDLESVDWPESVKAMQRNWIGRSEGANVRFATPAGDLEVFTTRPDTLFGVTYMVLSPEHAFVKTLTSPGQRGAVEAYVQAAARKSDLERTDLAKEKTGVFTGGYATNPVNGKQVPVWVADYVLASYGTGAIMAVPGHDQRDFDFARVYGLPIIPVVSPDGKPFEIGDIATAEDGYAINSGEFDGLPTCDFKKRITEWLAERKLGRFAVNYKLRDWLFSRQRYWGEPFPLYLREDGTVVPAGEGELPFELPEIDKFEPSGTGESPLATLPEWVDCVEPATGQPAHRETNTMPQWAGSCWYYLRYVDPRNPERLIDPDKAARWLPVDLYIGGAEHAVLHLLYARFWHKFLYDLGVVPSKEPFQKLVNQGMILGEDGEKMSKSRGNVINPDQVVAEYGADTVRLYEMFMGPLEVVKPWNTQGMTGTKRFLDRVWTLFEEGITEEAPPEELLRLTHRTIRKVTQDLDNLRFNTAISALMVLVNALVKDHVRARALLEPFTRLLFPFAPHLAEELGERLGRDQSWWQAEWPGWDEALAREETVSVAVQVNGKLRATLEVERDLAQEALLALVLEHERIRPHLEGHAIVKRVVVPNRLVNLVVK